MKVKMKEKVLYLNEYESEPSWRAPVQVQTGLL